MAYFFLPLILFFQLGATCFAAIDGRGEIAIETRYFEDDQNTKTMDKSGAIFSRVDSTLTLETYPNFEGKFRGFARVDREDEHRNVVKFEDFYLGYLFEEPDITIKLGWHMFNWTATEAFHPADVINSRNLDSNLETPEKFGEMGLTVTKNFEVASLSFFFFPHYEDPMVPAFSSRFGAGYNIHDARWVEFDGTQSADSWGIQGGMRFTTTIGDADISLHGLHMMDRHHPLILLDESANLSPYYFKVNQFGGTMSYVLFEGMIYKFEGAYKDFTNKQVTGFTLSHPLLAEGIQVVGRSKDHGQLANGLEKSFLIFNSYDFTLILEHQIYLGINPATRAGLGIFQNDVLLGGRLAFNDAMGKEMLLLLIADVERSQEIYFNFKYAQRLTDTWSINGGIRLFHAPKKEATIKGMQLLNDSDHIFATLTRFF